MKIHCIHLAQRSNRQPPTSGFTLIELLVTISIISVLLAILLPALSRVRAVGSRTNCATRLREVASAALMYVQSENAFPPLNNEPFDGHWQYNYVVWDGNDTEANFGPFFDRNLLGEPQILYCPVQKSAYHQFNTFVNPWPFQPLLDTRAGYGRRPQITGLDVTQIKPSTALYADLFHTSDYIEYAHRDGVNAAYSDGHVRYVGGVDDFLDNDMTLPTSIIDNPIMLDLWKKLDRRG